MKEIYENPYDILEREIIRIYGFRGNGYFPRHMLEQYIASVGLDPDKRNNIIAVLNYDNRLFAKNRLYLKHNQNKNPAESAWDLMDRDEARLLGEEQRRERYEKPSDRNMREWKEDVKSGNSDEPISVIQLRRRLKEHRAEAWRQEEKMMDNYWTILSKEHRRNEAARKRNEQKEQELNRREQETKEQEAKPKFRVVNNDTNK